MASSFEYRGWMVETKRFPWTLRLTEDGKPDGIMARVEIRAQHIETGAYMYSASVALLSKDDIDKDNLTTGQALVKVHSMWELSRQKMDGAIKDVMNFTKRGVRKLNKALRKVPHGDIAARFRALDEAYQRMSGKPIGRGHGKPEAQSEYTFAARG